MLMMMTMIIHHCHKIYPKLNGGAKPKIWADTAPLLQPGGNASNRSKLHFNIEKKSPVSIQLVKQR